MSRAAAVMVGIVNRSNPEFTAHVTVSWVDAGENELLFFYGVLLHARARSSITKTGGRFRVFLFSRYWERRRNVCIDACTGTNITNRLYTCGCTGRDQTKRMRAPIYAIYLFPTSDEQNE